MFEKSVPTNTPSLESTDPAHFLEKKLLPKKISNKIKDSCQDCESDVQRVIDECSKGIDNCILELIICYNDCSADCYSCVCEAVAEIFGIACDDIKMLIFLPQKQFESPQNSEMLPFNKIAKTFKKMLTPQMKDSCKECEAIVVDVIEKCTDQKDIEKFIYCLLNDQVTSYSKSDCNDCTCAALKNIIGFNACDIDMSTENSIICSNCIGKIDNTAYICSKSSTDLKSYVECLQSGVSPECSDCAYDTLKEIQSIIQKNEGIAKIFVNQLEDSCDACIQDIENLMNECIFSFDIINCIVEFMADSLITADDCYECIYDVVCNVLQESFGINCNNSDDHMDEAMQRIDILKKILIDRMKDVQLYDIMPLEDSCQELTQDAVDLLNQCLSLDFIACLEEIVDDVPWLATDFVYCVCEMLGINCEEIDLSPLPKIISSPNYQDFCTDCVIDIKSTLVGCNSVENIYICFKNIFEKIDIWYAECYACACDILTNFLHLDCFKVLPLRNLKKARKLEMDVNENSVKIYREVATLKLQDDCEECAELFVDSVEECSTQMNIEKFLYCLLDDLVRRHACIECMCAALENILGYDDACSSFMKQVLIREDLCTQSCLDEIQDLANKCAQTYSVADKYLKCLVDGISTGCHSCLCAVLEQEFDYICPNSVRKVKNSFGLTKAKLYKIVGDLLQQNPVTDHRKRENMVRKEKNKIIANVFIDGIKHSCDGYWSKLGQEILGRCVNGEDFAICLQEIFEMMDVDDCICLTAQEMFNIKCNERK